LGARLKGVSNVPLGDPPGGSWNIETTESSASPKGEDCLTLGKHF